MRYCACHEALYKGRYLRDLPFAAGSWSYSIDLMAPSEFQRKNEELLVRGGYMPHIYAERWCECHVEGSSGCCGDVATSVCDDCGTATCESHELVCANCEAITCRECEHACTAPDVRELVGAA